MKTATEAQQRRAPLSGCPAPRHLSASMRSLPSIAATQFRRSRGPVVSRPVVLCSCSGAVKFRHFQGNPAFSRLFEGRKNIADTTAQRRLFPIKPIQAQSRSARKTRSRDSAIMPARFRQLRPVHPISGFQRFSFQRFPPIQVASSQIKLWPPDATM
jgi:hypothetical protein